MDQQDTTEIDKPLQVSKSFDKLDEILAEYDRSLGLPNVETSQEIEKYMEMNRTQMEALTIEECAEANVLFKVAAYNLNKEINRQKARLFWADNYIESIICKTADSMFGTNFKHKDRQAIKQDSAAAKAHQIKIQAQVRVDNLAYLSTSLRDIGETFLNLQRAKATKNE